jgi:hypothetical protein
MTNGNDMIEHIEKCEECQKLQEQIDKLVEQQIDCWNYKMSGGY